MYTALDPALYYFRLEGTSVLLLMMQIIFPRLCILDCVRAMSYDQSIVILSTLVVRLSFLQRSIAGG